MHVKKILGKCSVLGFIWIVCFVCVCFWNPWREGEFPILSYVASSREELCHISVFILDSRWFVFFLLFHVCTDFNVDLFSKKKCTPFTCPKKREFFSVFELPFFSIPRLACEMEIVNFISISCLESHWCFNGARLDYDGARLDYGSVEFEVPSVWLLADKYYYSFAHNSYSWSFLPFCY